MKYLGDFPVDQPVYFMWNTNDANGASITRATDGTISVYKDNSDGSSFDQTQVITGVTNDEDVDGLIGVHSCCITTTNAWYETGHDYTVVISAATIDGKVVNAILAQFSIENRFMRGTDSANTTKTGFALSATGADLITKTSTFALAMADATWDEVLTGATHNIATSAGKRLREIAAFAIHSGTAQGGNATSITIDAGASGDDGVYNRNLIAIVGGTGAGQTRQIADYNGTSNVVTVDREWRVQPNATSEYVITASNVFALVDQGQAVAATATTITLRAYASSVTNIYLCNQVVIIAGTGRGQSRLVGAYDGASKTVTICGDDWVTIPDTTSTYVLLPYGTTCTSCMGDYTLTQIKSEADSALSDVDLDKHDSKMTGLIMSQY